MRTIALLLTVLTGFTGLVYEVTWQKCLATLLGSHSEATAAVLGIFLGGLSVGYSLFGRATHGLVERAERQGRPPALLRFYGLVETGIGIWAVLFPLLFAGVQALSIRLPFSDTEAGFFFDVGLTVLLIGPPTVLMGGTIPVLTQALARSLSDATRVHAYIYAFNTAGAFVGALAGGLWLVPQFGIENVLRAMGVLNLVAGSSFMLLGRHPQPIATAGAAPAPAAGAATAPRGFAAYALVATLLGFAMMATQTVLIRIGGLSLGASHFTFAMVVAVFVLCIALGSLAVSAAPRVPEWALPVSVWLLAICFLALYPEVDDATYWAHVLRTHFSVSSADFYPFHLAAFAFLFAVLALPVGLSGATLPLLFHHLRREVGDLGGVAGRLYSWNTVGNLLGALVGGYLLLLWLDLHQVYRIAVAALLVAGFVLNALVSRVPTGSNVVALVALSLPLVLMPAWDPSHLAAGLFRERRASPLQKLGPDEFFARREPGIAIEFYDDDPSVSVAVKGAAEPGLMSPRGIIVNGKPDSSTHTDYPTMALSGLVPCLLADACERAFVIGLGTGVTAGELGSLDSMKQVVVAEISRGVVEAAPFFDFANHDVTKNPKIEIVRSDAYRALLRSEGRYDIITSEPSNPWVSGVEMLYSREFLEAARNRLEPGGVYAQWFGTYETDEATTELILRTYLKVFDHVSVWFTIGPDTLLLGFRSPEGALDLHRIEERVALPDYAAGLRRAKVDSLPALLAHEILPIDTLRELHLEGPVHTLLHPRLSDLAARAFFQGKLARMPSPAPEPAASVARSHSLLQRWLAENRDRVDDRVRREIVDQVCSSRSSECVSALAWWQSESPDAPELARLVAAATRNPMFRESRLDHLEHTRQLFGEDGARGRVSYDDAQLATTIFEVSYFAPLPFHSDALRSIWMRCQEPADRCEQGRREFEERFGSDARRQAAGPG